MVHKEKVVHTRAMRTSVTLDKDVRDFVFSYARGRGISLSAALNELVRKAETLPAVETNTAVRRSANGFPLLPRTGQVLTSEMVKRYSEEEYE